MRDRLPLLIIGGLLLLGVMGSFLVTGAKRGAFADRLSSYRSEPDGARALYLLLEPTLEVSRWQRSIDDDLLPGQTLLLLGVRFENELTRPRFSTDGGVDDEWSEDEKDDFHQRGLNALRAPKVSTDESEKLLQRVREGGTVIYAPWRHQQNAFLDALGVKLAPPQDAPGIRTLVPAQPTPFTVGVERIEARVDAFLELPADAVPLLADEHSDDIVAALVKYGQGKVLVLASSELAMNRALARADNAQAWRSMLRALGTRALTFDEFHHGFTGERSLGEFASRSGLHIAAAQLLLGIIFWAASLRRFGRPREPTATLRVGATDALDATSRLYREGRHFDHAASTIVRQLAAECAERAGVAGHSSPTDISAALDARGRKDLSAALLSVARAAHSVSSDADLETVARLAALTRLKLHSLRT